MEDKKERIDILSKRLKNISNELAQTNLLAVTKYSPVEDLEIVYELGLRDFGENRVEDLRTKAEYFQNVKKDLVKWHFIGHLQSNKVKDLLKTPNLNSIHSIDSMSLLEELYKREDHFIGESLNLFLQFKTSKEEEKFGFSNFLELTKAVEYIRARTHSKYVLRGLMTMGTLRTEDFEGEAVRCFKDLRSIKETLDKTYGMDLQLSMGMSQDYHLAVAEGSHFVRIGSKIFK